MELLYYILKVSACLTFFFAFYLLLLRKLTFFKTNRFYLLGTLLLSFLIPLLNFTIEREVKATMETEQMALQTQTFDAQQSTIDILSTPSSIVSSSTEQTAFNWQTLILPIYILVAAALLIIALWRIFGLVKHIKKDVCQIGNIKIVAKNKGFTNCSFFNYVFVNQQQLTPHELQILLAHESVHIKQLHSIDKMLLLVAKVVLWINPLVYLYDKALEETHEFEADLLTSATFGASNYANLLLRLAIVKQTEPLIHNFVKSPVRQRIKMLFNQKSKNMKRWMYLLSLPILMLLVWSFTVEVAEVHTKQDKDKFTLIIDAGHGGKQDGFDYRGIKEKDLTLAIANKIKAIVEKNGINVIITRVDDKTVSVNERLRNKGDFFISLHINESKDTRQNGIQMVGNFVHLHQDRSKDITYFLKDNLGKIGATMNRSLANGSNYAILNNDIPSILLQLGFISNANDRSFLINADKQEQLSTAIGNAFLKYTQDLTVNEEAKKQISESEKIGLEISKWQNSEKHRRLTAEASKLVGKSVSGKIESLHYFGVNKILDGVILNSNGKKYRVYIHPTEMAKLDLKPSQKFSVDVQRAEVCYDSDYPVIITTDFGRLKLSKKNNLEDKAKVISSSAIKGDLNSGVTYIQRPIIDIGGQLLSAYEAAWDRTNEIITAKNATLKLKDGNTVTETYIIYDLKNNSFITNKTPGNNITVSSEAYNLISKLKLENTSLSNFDFLGYKKGVSGDVKVTIGGYSIRAKVLMADVSSNVLTAHMATITDLKGNTTAGDILEFDVTDQSYWVTKPTGGIY